MPRETNRPPQINEESWHHWLAEMFPHDRAPLAAHHGQFWQWIWEMPRDEPPHPFVALWSRGGAKSTNVERGCAAVGALGRRRYAIYVSGTQSQADDHVASIATILESERIARFYPLLGAPAVNRFGAMRGWRRNRLRTAGHFTIDALGLDTPVRGIRIDDDRPDFIVIDDIDDQFDSVAITDKKMALLAKKILPAGAHNVAVVAVQNMIGADTVFARLANASETVPDILHDRIVSGPHPALTDFAYEQLADGTFRIVSGTPTWAGQNLAVCQAFINRFGISAFLSECQHDIASPYGGMFPRTYPHCTHDAVPQLIRVAVWVDPAVTNTDKSDCQAIQVDGLGVDGKIYRLYSWEQTASPKAAIRLALKKAVEYRAQAVGIETDQGGDTWQSVMREAVGDLLAEEGIDARMIGYRSAKAGAGHGPKVHRAQQQLTEYERGGFVHVYGTHDIAERAYLRFPKTKPYDLVDAGYWSWADLRNRLDNAGGAVAGRRTTMTTEQYLGGSTPYGG